MAVAFSVGVVCETSYTSHRLSAIVVCNVEIRHNTGSNAARNRLPRPLCSDSFMLSIGGVGETLPWVPSSMAPGGKIM